MGGCCRLGVAVPNDVTPDGLLSRLNVMAEHQEAQDG